MSIGRQLALKKAYFLSFLLIALFSSPVLSQDYKLVGTGTLEGGQVFAMDPADFSVERWVDFSAGKNPPYTRLLEHNGRFWSMTQNGGSHAAGIIFSMNTDGSDYQIEHHFNTSEGGSPQGDLVLSNNRFWGTTVSGGDYNKGVIFSMHTDGTEFTVVHSFGGTGDGWSSYGGLVAWGDELWGLTYQAGTTGNGTIYRLQNEGTGYESVHNFDNVNGRGSFGACKLLEMNGKFYGMSLGGDHSHGVIFSINTDGTGYAKLYDFDGLIAGEPYGSLIEVDGELYGMTSGFGAGSTYPGTIFKFNPESGILTPLHQFSDNKIAPGGDTPFGDLTAYDGKLFGMTSGLSGYTNGTLFSIHTDGTNYQVLNSFLVGEGVGGFSPGGTLIVHDSKLWGLTSSGGGNNYGGTVFSIHPDGTAFNVIHNFGYSKGNFPAGRLAESDEKLWGTTSYQGVEAGSWGTIFTTGIDGSGFETVHHFTHPYGIVANPLYAYEEKLWGTMRSSSISSKHGALYFINNDGTEFTLVHDFEESTPFGSLVASRGKLWGMTKDGGSAGQGSIYSVNPDGTAYTRVHEFNGSLGALPHGSLVESGEKLWGLTQSGGANGRGVIFTLDPLTLDYQVVYDFDISDGPNQAGHPYGSLVEQNGKLWGLVEYGGPSGGGGVFLINLDGSGFEKVYSFASSMGAKHFGRLLPFNGHLYGIADNGGANGFGFTYRIKDDGTEFEKLYDSDFDTGGNPWYGASFIAVDQNMRPTFTQIPTQGLDEDQAGFQVVLSNYFDDVEDGPEGLSYTLEDISNPALFASTPISSGHLSLHLAADAFGTTEMTVRATDTGGKFIECTFIIEVEPVADAPVISESSTVYGVITSTGLLAGRNAVDGAEVTHVQVTDISNGTLFLSDGVTEVSNNAFVPFSQAESGFRFLPDFVGPISFNIQASVGSIPDGLGGGKVPAMISVAKKTLTVRPDDKTREYGAANPAFTMAYTGFVFGENTSVISTLPLASTVATSLSDAGTYDITASGGTDNHYDFAFSAGTLIVSKAELIVTAEDKEKAYGEANPLLTLLYSAFLNGDDASDIDTPPVLSTSVTASSDAGTYAISLSGGSDNNYDLLMQNGSLTINKLLLTATANDFSKVYGEVNPAFEISYSGFLAGEGPEVLDTPPVAASAALVNSPVGDYDITLSGGMDNNYLFENVNGTLSITKASLLARADDQMRSYGETNPVHTVSYTGLISGDDPAGIENPPSASCLANSGSDVGTYDIVLGPGSDNNYLISTINGTLTIGKAELTVTAEDKSKVYGEANPLMTALYSGFVNGDGEADIDTPPGLSTSATISSNAGTYAISLSGGSDNNYDLLLQNGILTIDKLLLTATANDHTKVYGEANPAFDISYSGFLSGEGPGVLDTPAVATSTADFNSQVGTYEIALSGGMDNNYLFENVNGILSITKASLLARADNQMRSYGEINPALTVTYNGLIAGDDPSTLDNPPSASCLANADSDARTYDIVLGPGSDNNYLISTENGTLEITKAKLTVSAEDKSKVYGETIPELTLSYTGFLGGDSETDIDTPPEVSTTANDRSAVGEYPISLSAGTDNNYEIDLTEGLLTVGRAVLNISIGDASRKYGEDNPEFILTFLGFVLGEDLSSLATLPVGLTDAGPTSDVGQYAITLDRFQSLNYTFEVSEGILSIEKADQLITFPELEDVLLKTGSLELVADATSGLPPAFESGDNTIASISGNIITLLNPGEVSITASQPGNHNYHAAVPVERILTIIDNTAVEDVEAFNISVYPNPASNYFVLALNREPVGDIYMINQEGKVVKRFRYSEDAEYDIHAFPVGLYFVVLETENDGMVKHKLVVTD